MTKAIESRVARIKARVAELTGKTQPEATTLNDAQYEDRSPSRSPRGPSDDERGSQRHHYYDIENEHHEAAYSPHQRRRLSKTHGSRSPSPDYDSEFEKKMRKLEELEEKEKEDQAREKYEEESIVKKNTEKVIEELNRMKKKEKAKKEADKEFIERVKKTFVQAGYDEERIDEILKKEEKEKEHGHGKEIKISDLSRPTYIRVHRKHISLETLNEYKLPWHWDDVSSVLRCRLSKCLDR